MTTTDTLSAREYTHGNFSDVAYCATCLKTEFYAASRRSGNIISSVQHEAVDMICAKLARIACGDPNFADHWHDIAGYATLVEQRIPKQP